MNGVGSDTGQAETHRHVTIPWRGGMLKEMRETDAYLMGRTERKD